MGNSIRYKHVENIPASETSSETCALWRVYCRDDNGGFRVSLEYGSYLEYFDDDEATRRAGTAIDVRKIDPEFSSVSIQVLQEESKQRWKEIRSLSEKPAAAPTPSLGDQLRAMLGLAKAI